MKRNSSDKGKNPKSFRLSAEEEQQLAQIALDNGLPDITAAFHFVLRCHAAGKIPAPIKPAIPSLEALDDFIRRLDQFVENLGPVARHAQVRHLPSESPEREAEVNQWHARLRTTYVELEEIMNDLRRARRGILACKKLNVERLRNGERALRLSGESLGREIKAPGAKNQNSLAKQLDIVNELRAFLHACGIHSEDLKKATPTTSAYPVKPLAG